ncbi:MAG: hypothetical protein OEX21_12815 [Betaproteobacteria bacterium]|nr:hypothetical protein [Betaproteobacteria bacterium]
MLCVALAASLGGCGREPPLAPELQAIRCPLNRPAHARATFVNAKITFVCISKELADTPYLLRCDLESRPMICEDEGSLAFTRDAAGDLFAGYGPRGKDGSSPDALGGSRLTVHFRKGPPRTSTFDEVETDWRFLLPEAKVLLPPGFIPVKGALCDRHATVLNSGTCNLEARSASLYWHISVAVLAEKGTPISPDEYLAELKLWLGLLDKMVVDPSK